MFSGAPCDRGVNGSADKVKRLGELESDGGAAAVSKAGFLGKMALEGIVE